MNKLAVFLATAALCAAVACTAERGKPLPRTSPGPDLAQAFRTWQDSVDASRSKPEMLQVIMHNIMVLQDGKVVFEKNMDPEWPSDRPQHIFSASKTFTALAAGIAVDDGLITVEDRVVDFFPDKLPEEVSDNLKELRIKDLLTMQCGHDTDPTWDTMAAYDTTSMEIRLKPDVDLAEAFLNHPFVHEPGTFFCYNSLCTYMVSAIVQKVEGKNIRDLLDERVFSHLSIQTPEWDMDKDGVCCGGWGLHLKIEDMAKAGQFMLQKGKWKGKQLISQEWMEEQTRKHIDNYPEGKTAEELDSPYLPLSRNDWVAGYGYQTWRNTVGGYRADGAWGQMIVVLPEQNAVIAGQANLTNHLAELWSYWDYLLPALSPGPKPLPRANASKELKAGFDALIAEVIESLAEPIDYTTAVNLHSIMVIKDDKVVEEMYAPSWDRNKPHAMFSISKTFTATAVGLAISEGKMALTDKVADFFPDKVVEGNPCHATVEDLLMMAGGHDTDPSLQVLEFDRKTVDTHIKEGSDIAAAFFAHPFLHEPGTFFCYNSLGTYLLSAIVTKVTGESVLDYLTPRLFEPLGIEKPEWDADDNGISAGGWGLKLVPEQMARMGLLLLHEGKWNGKQLVPADWVRAMGANHIWSTPATIRAEDCEKQLGYPDSVNDWRQGYGYQTWRNRTEGFRADGAGGQVILVLPEKNAVVIMTAFLSDAQHQLDLIWKYIYPNL